MTKAESISPARKDILEALSHYQRQGAVAVTAHEMGGMLADESDRGVVVILSSLLEDILLGRLMRGFANLNAAERKNLTRAGGLLANFDDRINLARALGIISQESVEMLQVFKALRNACAHSRRKIDFLTPEVRAALGLLFDGEGAEEIRTSVRDPMVMRVAFLSAFVFQSERILGSSVEQAQDTAQAIMNSMQAEVQKAVEKHQASREKRTKRPVSRPRKSPTD